MTLSELPSNSGHEPTGSVPIAPETFYAAYPPFRKTVLSLRGEVARLGLPSRHKAHLGFGRSGSQHGSGNFKDAYHLPGYDNLLVKLFKDRHLTLRTQLVKTETASLTRLHGLNDFEQLVASSPEDGAIIVEEFDGVPLEEATDEMINGLTTDVLTRAVASIKTASEKGVWLDRNPGNILVGKTQSRLFFLDPHLENRPNYFELNVLSLAVKLAYAGEKDDPADETVSSSNRLAVLKRLKEITQSQFPDLRVLDSELELIINRFE